MTKNQLIDELREACLHLVLQVEKLADKYMDSEVEEWIQQNPAIKRAKTAIEHADEKTLWFCKK